MLDTELGAAPALPAPAAGEIGSGDHAAGDHAAGDLAAGDHAAGDQAAGELGAGRLPAPGAGWRVVAGYVDLFAVLREPDRAGNDRRRHHVLRASPGAIVLGLPETGFTLVAVGSLEAAVAPVALAGLLDGAAGPDGAAVNAWCRSLATLLPEGGTLPGWVAAAEARTLQAGETLQGDPARMLWVAADPGLLSAPAGLVAAPLVALPPRGWIRAERDGTVRIMRLAAACDHDRPSLAVALEQFHGGAMAQLAASMRAAEAALSARLEMRREEDAAALSAGLHRLARGSAETAASAPLRAGEDPAVAVCRMAAAACGADMLRITAPPDAGGPAGTHEPMIDRVERIAALAQLRCRRVLLTADWWRRDRGVLIGFAHRTADRPGEGAAGDPVAGSGAPCLLLPARGGYCLRTASGGAERAVDAAGAHALWVEALQIYRVLPERPAGLRSIFAFALRGVGGDAGAFLAMAVATGLLTLLPPLAAGLLFDTIIPRAEVNRVLEVTGALVVLALSGLCFELVKAAALVRIEGRLSLFAQAALIERLLRLPARFFADYASGDLANRLLGIEEIRRTLTANTVITLLTGALSVFSLGLIFVLDPVLAALCAAMLALALAAALALNVSALHAERAGLLVRGRQEGLVVQLVIGIAKLKVAAAEGRAMRVWLDGLARQQASAARVLTMRTWLRVLAAMLPVIGLATLFAGVSLLGGSTLLASGARLPLGTFMAFIAALGNLLAAVLTIAVQLTGALRSIPLYERARPLLATPTEPRGARRVAALKGGIELCDVTFRYDLHGLPVLDRLSLRIAPQEYVAFVGASGSGKSTLMRLLLGFEQPEQGVILYDGTGQDQFDPASLRAQMGVVLQQSRLSPGNVFQNIVGNSGASLDDAWAAARLAGLAADIEALPMGMHTTVLEGGQGLSGGQRQRLMIARALVTRPRILLLDEATSALDNRTQDVVAAALAGLPATRVVIAHRLSTIERADRIFVLDRGRLVQSGSYAELLAAKGPFAELAARQLLAGHG